MKHHRAKPDFKFVVDPVEFNKYTEHELLQYCLGATMYMPGTKNIADSVLNHKWPELTSMVMCFEDAIAEEDLSQAEDNVLRTLDKLIDALAKGTISLNDLPLFILRVRNVKQFIEFSKRLTSEHIGLITAFNFPKFSSNNGDDYLKHLRLINETHGEIVYGMPILESPSIAYKETRIQELLNIRNILGKYRDLILNIRVGATDLSSCFGVRRGIDYSIYDILTVKECLSDILNVLGRQDTNYVISAPVWEYFLVDRSKKFEPLPDYNIHTSLLTRSKVINAATDGLLREIIIDKANGFVGKTVIHPSHIKFVNAMHAVTREEYEDAVQVLEASGGVLKSSKANKMNEVNPHRSWAKKIFSRAKAYGVIESEACYFKLFSEEVQEREQVLA